MFVTIKHKRISSAVKISCIWDSPDLEEFSGSLRFDE